MNNRSLLAMLSIMVCSIVLIFGLIVAPSFAAKKADTKTQGKAEMPEITSAAEDVAKSPPMSLDTIQARGKDGLNEVQGSADADKMYSSRMDKPGPAIAKDAKKALSKAAR